MPDLLDSNLDGIWTEGLNSIIWAVNDVCPFKCWYCPEPTWGGNTKTPYTWEQCSDFIDVVRERIQTSTLVITGGEPTDWPLFTKVLDKVNELTRTGQTGWYPLVMTNMSKSKGFIDEWIDKASSVIASYHPDVINTSKKRDIWFEKALSFKDRTRLKIKVLMDPRHWDHCLETYNTLDVEGIIVEPAKLQNFIDGYHTNEVNSAFIKEYSQEQLEILSELKIKFGGKYIEQTGNEHTLEYALEYSNGSTQVLKGEEIFGATQQIMSKGMNRFKGWLCELGIKNLFINPNGDIANAVCMGARKKYIGNMSDIDSIEWATKPTICPYEWCLCDGDVYISKYKL